MITNYNFVGTIPKGYKHHNKLSQIQFYITTKLSYVYKYLIAIQLELLSIFIAPKCDDTKIK